MDGRYYITETLKGAPISYIRVSQIDPTMINFLWNQWDLNQITPGIIIALLCKVLILIIYIGYIVNVDVPAPSSKVCTQQA